MGCGSSTSTKSKSWSEFESWMLDTHNYYRSSHESPPLKLNRDLCQIAQSWADHLGQHEDLEYAGLHIEGSQEDQRQYQGQTCGQNVAFFMGMVSTYKEVGYDPTKNWYSEMKDYDFSSPGEQQSTGHFTQVVWRATEELGVAKTDIKVGDRSFTYFVATYFPAGNVEDEYEENVKPEQDQAI